MIRAGASMSLARRAPRQFWEAQHLIKALLDMQTVEPNQGWLLPPPGLEQFAAKSRLHEPTRRERLEAETELFGFAVSGHPLELFADVAWDTYCPVESAGRARRRNGGDVWAGRGAAHAPPDHRRADEIPDAGRLDGHGGDGTVRATYKSYGLATVRYPVLEVTATVEPFENGRGFSLRVLRAGKPREKVRGAPGRLADDEAGSRDPVKRINPFEYLNLR